MQLVVCLVLTGLSLWPIRPLESLLDSVCVSTRPILSAGRPLWGLGRVHASDGEQEERWRKEMEESGYLEQWVRDQAAPRSVPLQAGIALHAEAVGRPKGKLDTLLVRVWHSGLVRIGMPVTAGDHFVGLVKSVLTREGMEGAFDEVVVELITSSDARVGAGVFAHGDWQRDSRFVVGGLLAAENFGLGQEREVLAVHHPSNQALAAGRVLVHEKQGGGRDLAWLANGFLLGTLERAPEPDQHTRMDLMGVIPEVDFESGIYQVLIHTGLSDSDLEETRAEGGTQGEWVLVSRVPLVDAAPWREGFKLPIGSRSGVQVGAAVANGARLVGRVNRVGWFHSNVSGPGDPGFAVPALALWLNADADHPTFVMGRLKSLGRDRKGNLLYAWPAALPMPGEQSAKARLYTGSGEPGVPRGLLLGETEVPTGAGPHTLVVQPPEQSAIWEQLEWFDFEGIDQ